MKGFGDTNKASERTKESFGYLWARVAAGDVPRDYESHVERTLRHLGWTMPRDGRVLDAGCGDGRDLATLAGPTAAYAVGIDFNQHLDAAADAVSGAPNAAVVRGSVLDPPFAPRSFSFVYSYGVLHHTTDPAAAFSALATLVEPGGRLVVYVYSDLREEPALRLALLAVNSLRVVSTRLPPRVLFAWSRMAAPVIFLLFAVPARLVRAVPRLRHLGDRLPFNFVRTPFGATGDLYDRFSAPIEHRHSKAEVERWYRAAGFEDIEVGRLPDVRGWVGVGTASSSSP